MEHFALDPGQGEDRQVHHHDDQLTENQRTTRFLGCREDLMQTLTTGQLAAKLVLRMSQTANSVLDDDHGTIDDDAEVECPQTHQVGADLVAEHAGEGEQHRQRNDHGCDQRRTDVTEEQEEDDDDQDSPFDQVLLDRGDGLVHQIGAVIDGHRNHPFRQRTVDLLQTCGHGLRHTAAVLADQHKHCSQHDLATILGRSTRT